MMPKVHDLPLCRRAVGPWFVGLLMLAATALLVSCGDSEGGAPASPTGPGGAQELTARPSPDSPPESGEAPVFWRDGNLFRDVRVNDDHKVIVRVTNGYDAETLLVTLESVDSAGEVYEIEALRSEPVGEEAPGHYYTFNMNVPTPGTWRLTATPGQDSGSITFQVTP